LLQGSDVILVKNGGWAANMGKLLEMLGGITRYVAPSDVVVIKANAQWPNQGYTHTGCIKALIDAVLAIPGFSGEVLICDNVQTYGEPGQLGFDTNSRDHNWPDHNYNSLAADYQSRGQPVAVKQWTNGSISNQTGPSSGVDANGIGWVREFFTFHGKQVALSYPYFRSPLNPGRIIDMKYGVWENQAYTGRRVQAIHMPTLNNHGDGTEDYAGVTSALKSFYGATEIPGGTTGSLNGALHIHSATYSDNPADNHPDYAGELAAHFIGHQYAPVLYITAAIYSGHQSRVGAATYTDTVLACHNPATLDYVACKQVISPYAPFLNPDLSNNTRAQIMGSIAGGVGTITPGQFSIQELDFRATANQVPALPLPYVGLAALGLGTLGCLAARRGDRACKG
jgi:hypothetical protein